MTITADDLRAPPVQVHKLDAPELGGDGHIYIRKLSVKGREDWEVWCDEVQTNGVAAAVSKYGFRGYLLARTLCDDRGALLFADPVDGLAVLNGCPGDVMNRLYEEAVSFNAIGQEAQQELEGNSQSGPSAESP